MAREHKQVSFKQPPVIEMVLGLQFDPIRNLSNAHLGAFWASLGEGWPNVRDVPPLEDQFETFDENASWGGVRMKLSQAPDSRLQVRNETGIRMIQVQNRRLHYNWLGEKDRGYPRYSAIRPEFDRVRQRFQEYLQVKGLGAPVFNQWEVTYVNHLLRPRDWENLADAAKPFRQSLAPVAELEGIELDSLAAHWHYEIKPRLGRLHVQVQHARKGGNGGDELLIVTLTARGPVARDGDIGGSIDDGLNLGHETIVNTFREITSSAAHRVWEIEE